jgi:hypothetical protein
MERTVDKVQAQNLMLDTVVVLPGNDFVDPVVGKVASLERVGCDVIVVLRTQAGERQEFTTSGPNAVWVLV